MSEGVCGDNLLDGGLGLGRAQSRALVGAGPAATIRTSVQKLAAFGVDGVVEFGGIVVTDVHAGVLLASPCRRHHRCVELLRGVVPSDGRRLRGLEGGLDWLDLAERVEILVLPLLNAHIEFFPLLLERLVSELLSHLFHRQILKQLLVVVQFVLHLIQLIGDNFHIDVLFVLNQANPI